MKKGEEAKRAVEAYKDAVWDYLLEHSDITHGGSLFIKFHADSRQTFEKHVRARLVYGYHREDPKLKEKKLQDIKSFHQVQKKLKQIQYKKDKAARLAALDLIKEEVRRVQRYNRIMARITCIKKWLKGS